MPESKNKLHDPVIQPGNGKYPYTGFVEMAVHDLQALLRKLGVLTDRLAHKYKHLVNDDADQYTSRINSCLLDMRSLIESLKEFGIVSLEPLQPAPCDIERVVKKLLHELEPALKETNATITMASLPSIEADRAQCRQLFKCIFDNAILFSKKDIPLMIDINCRLSGDQEKANRGLAGDKTYYRIEITDNGIGISSENAEIIFKPFTRLHGKAFAGNGLGLAIARQIVDNHGGIIYAEGEEGNCARFIILLPEKQ